MKARILAVVAAAVLAVALPAEAKGHHGGKAGAAKVEGVVNLNQATAAQLDLLPGVSPKAAQAIVAYREKEHFNRVEDLVRVKGFGKKKFEKLKTHLAVSGDTTIHPLAKGAKAQGRAMAKGGGR